MRSCLSACPLSPTRFYVRIVILTIAILLHYRSLCLIHSRQRQSVLGEIMSHAAINTVAAKSCLECRRRKIKCDKLVPCSYCVKVKIKCCYPAPRSTSNKDGSLGQSNEVLGTRIDRIESTLQSFENSISQIRELLQQSHPSLRPDRNQNRGLETCAANGQIISAERTVGSVYSTIHIFFHQMILMRY